MLCVVFDGNETTGCDVHASSVCAFSISFLGVYRSPFSAVCTLASPLRSCVVVLCCLSCGSLTRSGCGVAAFPVSMCDAMELYGSAGDCWCCAGVDVATTITAAYGSMYFDSR